MPIRPKMGFWGNFTPKMEKSLIVIPKGTSLHENTSNDV